MCEDKHSCTCSNSWLDRRTIGNAAVHAHWPSYIKYSFVAQSHDSTCQLRPTCCNQLVSSVHCFSGAQARDEAYPCFSRTENAHCTLDLDFTSFLRTLYQRTPSWLTTRVLRTHGNIPPIAIHCTLDQSLSFTESFVVTTRQFLTGFLRCLNSGTSKSPICGDHPTGKRLLVKPS